MLQHRTQCNYKTIICDMLLGVEWGSLGKGGVDSSEVFVIPYLIARLTAIKMFNLRI